MGLFLREIPPKPIGENTTRKKRERMEAATMRNHSLNRKELRYEVLESKQGKRVFPSKDGH